MVIHVASGSSFLSNARWPGLEPRENEPMLLLSRPENMQLNAVSISGKHNKSCVAVAYDKC
jgi:hypothetical protein